jgi:hypothetical protein
VGSGQGCKGCCRGQDLSGQIQTAFVERLKLTLRHLVAALRRKTWALAYNVRNLTLARGVGCRILQFLPDASYLTRTDGAGTIPWSNPAPGVGGDRACVERDGVPYKSL